jgi:ribose transport system substrate-binding protein
VRVKVTSTKNYTIGFSNLDEKSHFCMTVRESLEAAAAQHPELSLVVRDNALNDENALANARYFAELPVNLAIIFHINERIGPKLAQMLMAKRVPIIAVDVPIPLTTYFGVDNRQAGAMVGQKLVEWINTRWDGKVDKVLALTETRVLDAVKARTTATIDTLISQFNYDPHNVLYIDCGHERALTVERTLGVLQSWSQYERIAAIGFSEDPTLGIIEAVRMLGRESSVAVVGQSADEATFEELRRPDTPLIATIGYRPQTYGGHLINLALRILKGEKVPPHNYIELDLYTQESARGD